MEKENGISLSEIFRSVWKNKILMGIVTLVVLVLGIVYTFGFTTPMYAAKTDVVVAVAPTASGTDKESVDYTSSLKVVATVGAFAKSDAVANDVVANVTEYKLTALEVKGHTSTTASNTSFVVVITYTDADQKKAVVVVNAIAKALIENCKTNEAMSLLNVKLDTISEATGSYYVSPNKTLYCLIALVLGVVLSCCIVFVKEFMSSKFKTKDEIEAVTDLDVIGLFPDNKANAKLKYAPLPNKMSEYEPFNKLLSSIEYFNMGKNYKTIMFTSSSEDELKTTTACGLAKTLVNNEKKVVILDLDLRKQTVHKELAVERKDGIVDYLKGEKTVEEIIKTNTDGIDIITSGYDVINPIVVLKNEKLGTLIEELKKIYDYVIVDTPPVYGISDAFLLANYVDCCVFNVAINSTKKKICKESLKNLKNAGVNVIGVNAVKAELTKSEYYYYYNYYQTEK